MFHPSTRSAIDPFRVMQILGKAQQRDDALLLCVGQPRAGAPAPVMAAAQEALRGKPLGYTPTLGVPELREAIAAWHSTTYGVETRGDNVVVTTGSSGGFVAAFLLALDAGDTIALSRPGYPAYRNSLTALGVTIVDLECGPQTRYQPTVAHLTALESPPKAVIITSPDNPTGTIIDPEELGAIAHWCESNDVLLISDEIYHGISYGRRCATARSYSTEAIVVGSTSKYFCMTGWRLGWLIVPDRFVPLLENLEANLALCPPAISQWAALHAFTDESARELSAHVQDYQQVRDLLLRRLPELGLGTFAPPDGGFYFWVDVSHLTDNAEQWCDELLDATGVAIAPGVDFDPVGGNRFVRISFCVDLPTATLALDRLQGFLVP